MYISVNSDERPNVKKVDRLILGGRSHSVDLVDTPTSIDVALPDGLITLTEGLGPDRIHGWVLTPDTVQMFKVDRIEGRYGIRLFYKRRGAACQHFIGYVDDVSMAEAWVNCVNSIYEKNNAARCELAKGRETEYREYPVVNDILEKRTNIVLPGAYQYSYRKSRPKQKLSLWEKAYIDRCMELLAVRTGINKNSIRTDVRDYMPHDYEWLSERVRYDTEHFENRITQPMELIFDREQRHDRIMVNPFCSVQTFALVYFKNSILAKKLGFKKNKLITPSFSDFLDRFKGWSEDEHILLCAPGKQSVYYAFYDAHLAGSFDLYEHFHIRQDIHSMAAWLWQYAKYGFVVCDLGEVLALSNAINAFRGFEGDGTPLAHSIVPYDRQVPVGFCYRRDDPMWGEIGYQSLLDVCEHPSSKIRSDFDLFRKRILRIGIEVAA